MWLNHEVNYLSFVCLKWKEKMFCRQEKDLQGYKKNQLDSVFQVLASVNTIITMCVFLSDYAVINIV